MKNLLKVPALVVADPFQHINVGTSTAADGNIPAVADTSVNIACVKTFPILEERDITLDRQKRQPIRNWVMISPLLTATNRKKQLLRNRVNCITNTDPGYIEKTTDSKLGYTIFPMHTVNKVAVPCQILETVFVSPVLT